jgi:hypothetical protein
MRCAQWQRFRVNLPRLPFHALLAQVGPGSQSKTLHEPGGRQSIDERLKIDYGIVSDPAGGFQGLKVLSSCTSPLKTVERFQRDSKSASLKPDKP